MVLVQQTITIVIRQQQALTILVVIILGRGLALVLMEAMMHIVQKTKLLLAQPLPVMSCHIHYQIHCHMEVAQLYI